MKYAIIDVETTGLDPTRETMVEVAIIQYDGEQEEGRFCTLINPQQRISPEALRITGLRPSDIAGAPSFASIAKTIVEMTQDRILIGHNVRFDLTFLRRAFRELGYHFHRKRICTLRLAKERWPDWPSHRLGVLAKRLNLPREMGHRALSDAETTLALYRVLTRQAEPVEEESLKHSNLPPALSPAQFDNLPEKTGVYFFFNRAKELIYVGKSKEIRKRVVGHFNSDIHSEKSRRMKAEIAYIRYEITGSELVALLLESDLIKTLQPRYNRAQRNTRYRYGLLETMTAGGYASVAVETLKKGDNPLVAFSNRREAARFLNGLAARFELCQKMLGLEKGKGPCFHYHLKRCRGACLGTEDPEEYNLRLREALSRFSYQEGTVLIWGKGRFSGEKSVVLVENGVYRGFGFLPQKAMKYALSTVRKAIIPREENQDIRRIINAYLNGPHRDKVVRL